MIEWRLAPSFMRENINSTLEKQQFLQHFVWVCWLVGFIVVTFALASQPHGKTPAPVLGSLASTYLQYFTCWLANSSCSINACCKQWSTSLQFFVYFKNQLYLMEVTDLFLNLCCIFACNPLNLLGKSSILMGIWLQSGLPWSGWTWHTVFL